MSNTSLKNISETGIVVTLKITGTTGIRSSREQGQRLAGENAAETDAVTVALKCLPPKRINRVQNLRSAAYAVLRRPPFLPVLPEGGAESAILPVALFERGVETLNAAVAAWQAEVDCLCADYPTLLQTAPARLGTLWREGLLPDPQEFRARFSADRFLRPLPSSSPLAQLDSEWSRCVAESVERQSTEVERSIKNHVATLLREPLERLYEALASDGDFVLRQPSIAAVQDIATIAGDLDLTNDPGLETVRLKIASAFAGVKATALSDDAMRQSKLSEVKELMNDLANVL